MKKQILLLAALAAVSSGVTAQKKDFGYKFYGQVRTDLFYNSRSNSETVDGLFYMYPNDVAPDANGEDLNAKPDGNFYTLYTRLGLDVTGPMLGKAKTSAKVEVDFRGSGTTYSLFRIRHVYFNLDLMYEHLLYFKFPFAAFMSGSEKIELTLYPYIPLNNVDTLYDDASME